MNRTTNRDCLPPPAPDTLESLPDFEDTTERFVWAETTSTAADTMRAPSADYDEAMVRMASADWETP